MKLVVDSLLSQQQAGMPLHILDSLQPYAPHDRSLVDAHDHAGALSLAFFMSSERRQALERLTRQHRQLLESTPMIDACSGPDPFWLGASVQPSSLILVETSPKVAAGLKARDGSVQKRVDVVCGDIFSDSAKDEVDTHLAGQSANLAVLGNSYSNYPSGAWRKIVDRFVAIGNLVIIDTECLESPEDFALIAGRYGQKAEFHFRVLADLGVPRGAVVPKVRFDPDSFEVTIAFEPCSTLILASGETTVSVPAGMEVAVFKSRKPSLARLHSEWRDFEPMATQRHGLSVQTILKRA
ncbi:MAG TPA: hypothetical protein VF650_08560 [Allosphingosinicella sp.]|jgi:hypothetical protein